MEENLSSAVSDFQIARILHCLFGNGNAEIYDTRRAMRACVGYRNELEFDAVMRADRVVSIWRNWLVNTLASSE